MIVLGTVKKIPASNLPAKMMTGLFGVGMLDNYLFCASKFKVHLLLNPVMVEHTQCCLNIILSWGGDGEVIKGAVDSGRVVSVFNYRKIDRS